MTKKAAIHILSVLPFLLTSIFCSAASIDPALVDELSGKLAKILEPRVKVLDRDMITFHYEVGKGSKMNEDNLDNISRWILSKPARFYNSRIVDGNAGPGLYLAVDPVASRSYGSHSPQLSIIKVKNGARIVDVDSQSNADESAFLNELYSKISCNPDYKELNHFVEALPWLRNSSKPECVSIVINAFQKLQVQGILYFFSGADLNNCRDRALAINIIDANAAEVVSYFSEKTHFDSQRLSPYILNLYNEASVDYSMQMASVGPLGLPPKTISESVIPTDYQNWKESKILNCGAKWTTESNANVFSSILKKNLKKYADIRALIIQTKNAYDKIFNEAYFSFDRMNIIEKMEYENSKLAQDMSKFDQWKEAKDLLIGLYTGEDVSPEFSNLLEETEPSTIEWSTIQKSFENEVLANKDKEFDVLDLSYKYYLKSGLGPRLAQLILHGMNTYYGTPPVLIDPAEFKKALQHCIEVYNDPKQTQDSITNGECGIRQ